jgi:hypothetical protein
MQDGLLPFEARIRGTAEAGASISSSAAGNIFLARFVNPARLGLPER